MKWNLLASASILTVLCLTSAAYAQDTVADAVVARLQSNGYTVTEVRRSWLGRIVITAQSETNEREVVLNRTSGEILRDQTFAVTSPSTGAPARPTSSKGGKPGPKGPATPDGSAPGGGTGGGGIGGNG
ncbi:hypothetical protein [Litoreibacter janthinus]|uniref:Peptidase propeptide and YPEB domain-containing protein n=1 Tax=Litoreibacter janthinus TaxID=670154 RepID=A0A1I6HY10_9RHOB|nr:hypothetical protein [Litoreibacter janthinus]SFR59333.1 hypothetical protein SAMN04488002_3573 [Litoreibacter janthinus]